MLCDNKEGNSLYQLIFKFHKRIQVATNSFYGFPLEQADETCSKLFF